MSGLMRFNMIPAGQPNPSPNGLYVRHEDYDTLRTANQRLEGEVKALREALSALLEECDPLALNCGEPWCRARAVLVEFKCSGCGVISLDEYEHFDHVMCCAALAGDGGE